MKNIFCFIALCLSLQLPAQESKRIISLAQSITNNIYLLGAQNQLVGCTKFCLIAANNEIPIVADALNVNIEKLVSLKPDVVITTDLTSPRIIAAIQKMGIHTLQLPKIKDFNELCKQLEQIGEVCNKQEIAIQYIKESKSRLSKLPKPTLGKKVFMELGHNPLFTVLPDSFMDDYITFLGGENIFNGLTSGIVSKETVLVKNPDIIVIVAMGEMGKQSIDTWKKYNSLKAVQNNQLFILDANKACTPTPISFVDVLEDLIKKLKN